MRIAALIALEALSALCQEPPKEVASKLEFEVASIKPAAPQQAGQNRMGIRGGPGTQDPGYITVINMPLRFLIQNAFDLKAFQLQAPGAADDIHFDMEIKVPPGTTKEQGRIMMQNLLAKRFGMKVHHDSKEMQGYALTIAKGGAKLRAWAQAPPATDTAQPRVPASPKMDKNGFPEFPPGGRGMLMSFGNGEMRMTGAGATVAQICNFLGNQLGRPVVDQTGLTGTYDFNLAFAPENNPESRQQRGRFADIMPPPPPGGGAPGTGRGEGAGPQQPSDAAPTLMAAVQEQLGLKLEPKKVPVDFVVVDHIETMPNEN